MRRLCIAAALALSAVAAGAGEIGSGVNAAAAPMGKATPTRR